jgi:hypothetical protein
MEISTALVDKLALASAQAAEASELELSQVFHPVWQEYPEPPTSEQLTRYYEALTKCLVGEGILSAETLQKYT